jgi:nicotinate-nucleotide adenylyltransferase
MSTTPMPAHLDDALIAKLSAVLPPLRHLGRVGILGGSFNPPHIAHVLMALAAYATEELDHLWVIPTADHAFGKDLAPFDCRLRMCHLAFRHFAGGVAVLDVESRLPKPSYTVNLLRVLHAARPGIKPVWLAGSDILADLPRWKEPDEVQRLSRLVVLPRQGHPAPLAAKLAVDLPQLSSTDVRNMLQRGEACDGVLDMEVLTYIERTHLYSAASTDPSP